MRATKKWLGALAPLLVLLGATAVTGRAVADAPDASADASADASIDASVPVRPKVDEDLLRQGSRLLDNDDLLQRGGTLLPQRPRPRPVTGVARSMDGSAKLSGGASSEPLADAESGGAGDAAGAGDAGAEAEGRDASAAAVGAAADAVPPPVDPARLPPGPTRGGPPRKPPEPQLELKGPQESPLAALGVPPKAVPAVATVATVGIMALWPALFKALTGIAKSIAASILKNRGKKGKKIDTGGRVYRVLGLPVRPAEVAHIFLAAVVYGLAVCYVFQGKKLERGFLLRQEGLVLAIYYSRSLVRFVYERMRNLTTQYRFWVAGGVMCLVSAYLGSALGIVGYELEASNGPEDAKRAVRMKVWLLAFAFGVAVMFCIANIVSPTRLFQSGRVMMSGAALAEVLPIAPMPGQKILRESRALWIVLALVIVPGFFLMNFVL